MDAQTTATFHDHLYATVRTCYVLADNFLVSAETPHWTQKPTLRAVVIETVKVDEAHRRQGHCRAFINAVVEEAKRLGFQLVIVEGVVNRHLAEALMRWGWECDPGVMDFHLSL